MKAATRKFAALATTVALAFAFPAAVAANKGGVPNAHSNGHGKGHVSKPCKGKGKGNGPKKPAPNSHGKKCGFHKHG
jgi:hypothetical protein